MHLKKNIKRANWHNFRLVKRAKTNEENPQYTFKDYLSEGSPKAKRIIKFC